MKHQIVPPHYFHAEEDFRVRTGCSFALQPAVMPVNRYAVLEEEHSLEQDALHALAGYRGAAKSLCADSGISSSLLLSIVNTCT